MCFRSTILHNVRADTPARTHRLSGCPPTFPPAFSRDGAWVALQTSRTHAGIWSVSRWSEVTGLDEVGNIGRLALSQSGSHLATATQRGADITTTHTGNPSPPQTFRAHRTAASLAWSTPNATVVTASALPSNQESAGYLPIVVERFVDDSTFRPGSNCGMFLTRTVGLTTDAKRLVAIKEGSNDLGSPITTIVVFDFLREDMATTQFFDMGRLWNGRKITTFSADGSLLAIVHRDDPSRMPSTLDIVSLSDGASLHRAVPLRQGTGPQAPACTAVALSDRDLALGYEDGFIEVLGRTSLAALGTFGSSSKVAQLSLSPDSSKLAAVYSDQNFSLRDFGPM